jgi:hypothetical protein
MAVWPVCPSVHMKSVALASLWYRMLCMVLTPLYAVTGLSLIM